MNEGKTPSHVTLLGPQRRPTLDKVVSSLAADRPIATVTAGWQEREPDDGELDSLLGGRGANLGLHSRWQEVFEQDQELAVAEREHRRILDELTRLYLIRLDHALRALYAVVLRPTERPRMAAEVIADALAMVRLVDEQHLARVEAAHRNFDEAWRVHDHPLLSAHREEVRRILEQATALVVAGGHVGVLVRVFRIFGIASYLPASVIAWSAGAMTLTERVVLFHDHAPQGPAHAEVYDRGLGVLPDAVLLPDARRRLRVDDHTRMSMLSRRFAPARCVVLDDGVRIDLDAGAALPSSARVIAADGRIKNVGET